MNKKLKIPLTIVIAVISSVVIFIGVWLWFIVDGNIPTGTGLGKSDWLSFLGAFLTFIGTMFLGAVALWQTRKVIEQANKTIKQANKAIQQTEAANEIAKIGRASCRERV